MTEYLADKSRIGEKNFSMYWMKATSTPKVSAPFIISPPPYQMISATAIDDSASTRAYRDASQKMTGMLASRYDAFSRLKRRSSSRSWLNIWMMLMPEMHSLRKAFRFPRRARTSRNDDLIRRRKV